MEKKLKVDYDDNNDTLYFYSGDKVKGSIELDGLILDFNYDKELSGIEIQDASNFLTSYLDEKIPKEKLKKITYAIINYKIVKNTIYIKVDFNIDSKEVELPLSMQNPNVVYT